jgi:hypothetical protein
MADPITGVSPLLAVLPLPTAGGSALTIELAQLPPPALPPGITFTATVLGRGENGTLLLQTDQGTLSLKTPLTLPPGSSVALRLPAGAPGVVTLLHIDASATGSPGPAATAAGAGRAAAAPETASPAPAPAPAEVAIGTVLKGTVLGPPQNSTAEPLPPGTAPTLRLGVVPAAPVGSGDGTAEPLPPGTALTLRLGVVPAAPVGSGDGTAKPLPPGTALTLRLGVVPAAPVGSGDGTALPVLPATIVASTSSETIITTALGTIALDQKLALAPGSTIELQPLATLPPAPASENPRAAGHGWPALDQTLAVLDRVAPDLAARLRSDLTPASGAKLAGTLLFLMGALGSGAWPGDKVGEALERGGHGDLRLKLAGDTAELRHLADQPSGDWRVFVLPLLDGNTAHPLRLYLRRNGGGNTRPEDGTRFVLDVEMSRLGALQLDGLVQQKRLDVVLRSHRAIAPELRQEITDVFRDATSAAGLSGDIVFTTASRFAVAPLAALHGHVAVDA